MAIRRISGRITNKDGQSLGDAKVAADGSGDYRLYVDTNSIGNGAGVIGAFDKDLRHDDMNASNGGVARETNIGTSFTDIYSYTGSGLICSFLFSLEDQDKWYVRLVVDGVDLFNGSTGLYTKDFSDNDVYHAESDKVWAPSFRREGKTFFYEACRPILYETSVAVKIRHEDSSKKFEGGLIILSKVT